MQPVVPYLEIPNPVQDRNGTHGLIERIVGNVREPVGRLKDDIVQADAPEESDQVLVGKKKLKDEIVKEEKTRKYVPGCYDVLQVFVSS